MMQSSPEGTRLSEPDAIDVVEEACKECRRRKAKCDKVIPVCAPCSKYRRHCLYEKHARTPLTRQHLTNIEDRLERAERLLRKAKLNHLLPAPGYSQFPETKKCEPLLPKGTATNTALTSTTESALGTSVVPAESSDPGNAVYRSTFSSSLSRNTHDGSHGKEILNVVSLPHDECRSSDASVDLDGPPVMSDDFEWDEQHVTAAEASEMGSSPHSLKTGTGEEAESVTNDGMASLTIDESEGGYLGLASGAALLRLIGQRDAKGLSQRTKASRSFLRRFSVDTETLLFSQPEPNHHIVDTMIDAYFGLYNVSYPIVHEPTFRAQYSELIERPNGNCWKFLAYVIAAIGVFTSATVADTTDLLLFMQAKSLMHLSYLESGNLTLIQALTLMSNYLQKKNMPNSGYNYLGLATRMAMGIGLHKDFRGWELSPLKMETRRRVWWCLSVFDIGATITFGRPIVWPAGGIDVALPLNIHDRELTAASKKYPAPSDEITLYTAVRVHADLYQNTMPIYSKVISKPFPSAEELIDLDDRAIGEWYRTAHAVMMWKFRNLRIIMYRPFVIRKVLQVRKGSRVISIGESQAYDRCLQEAQSTILSIEYFWGHEVHTRMAAWYALYFLFQAALIPCICLQNEPESPNSDEWRHQVQKTLSVINDISALNPAGKRCHEVIWALCGRHLSGDDIPTSTPEPPNDPVDGLPQMQMDNVFSMMWSTAPSLEADLVMQDVNWTAFIDGENLLPFNGFGDNI